MNLRFIHNHLYPILAVLTLSIAASAWFTAALPQENAPPSSEPQTWQLPHATEPTSTASLEAINARNLWGVVLASDAAKLPEWNVLGIAKNGQEQFILMAYEGKPVEILQVGDTLPDGTKIVKIEQNRFFVITPDKKKIAFGLYKNDPAK